MLLVGAAVWLTSLSEAELTWESQKIELNATTEDQEAVTSFKFKNTGDAPVTILNLATDCGCTRTELTKKTYSPGEGGMIKTSFTVGVRVGVQEKHIQVTTNESPTTPIDLQLIVNIEQLVIVSPQTLLWKKADKLEEKSVTVTAGTSRKIASVEVLAITPVQTSVARVQTVEAGSKYQILLEPVSLVEPVSSTISCIARFQDKTYQRFPVLVLVR
jgi:hypothetical protein